VDSVPTIELGVADDADSNDVDGDAEEDDTMIGQRERKAEDVERAKTEGLGRGVNLLW
jgi:hypothetical protein